MRLRYPQSIMGNPRNNLIRILSMILILLALVACDDGIRVTPPPTGERPEGPSTGTIDLSKVIALGVGSGGEVASSALAAQSSDPTVLAISGKGEVSTVRDGSDTFEDFTVLNGRVFLRPHDVQGYGCALVEVINDTEPICVDPYLAYFRKLQIGPDGALYYEGAGADEHGYWVPALRKRTPEGDNQQLFDLSGPLQVMTWVVGSDGLVYLAGLTQTSSVTEFWLRRLNQDGSLTTIDLGHNVYLAGLWPDGSIYVSDPQRNALWELKPGEDTLSPTPYFGSLQPGYLDKYYDNVTHDIDALEFDLNDISAYSNPIRVHGDRVLLETTNHGEFKVMELYPSPQWFDPGLAQARDGVAHGEDYYYVGRNTENKFAVVRLGVTSGNAEPIYETDLEIFNIAVSPDASAAMFTALDAARNRYLMVTFDLATGETTTEPIGSTLVKLELIH